MVPSAAAPQPVPPARVARARRGERSRLPVLLGNLRREYRYRYSSFNIVATRIWLYKVLCTRVSRCVFDTFHCIYEFFIHVHISTVHCASERGCSCQNPLSVPDQVREGCYERERERLLNDRRSVERSLDQEKRIHREQNVDPTRGTQIVDFQASRGQIMSDLNVQFIGVATSEKKKEQCTEP